MSSRQVTGWKRGAWPTGLAPRTLASLLVATCLVAACSTSPAEPAARTVHAGSEGPLAASIGVGGNSIMAPGTTTWTGTFGGFALCAQEPDTVLEVQRIRHKASLEPIQVVPTVRTTRPAALRPLSPARRQAFLPTYTALGSPPEFAEPYVEVKVPGEYRTTVRGWQVDQTCEETATLERELNAGKVPSGTLKELMFVVTAGPEGAKIDRVDIDYLADGQPMTLRLHWAMVSCGTATAGPDICRP